MKKSLMVLLLSIFTLLAAEQITSYSYELTGLGVKPFFGQDGNWHDSEKLWISNSLDTAILGNRNSRLTYFNYNDFYTLHSKNSNLTNDSTGISGVTNNGNLVWLAGPNHPNEFWDGDSILSIQPYPGESVTSGKMKGIDNLYWFNNYDGEIFKYDHSDQSWTQYDTSNSGLSSDFVDNVFADSYGNIWVNHILRYPVKKSSISRMDSFENWHVYDSSNDVFANTIISTSSYNEGMHEDHNRNVWFPAWGSITRFDGETFHNYVYNSDFKEGEQFHQYVCYPNSDSVWFSSDSTIAIWDGEDMHFFPQETVFPSLLNLRHTDTYIDNRGNWWQSKYRKIDGVYYYSHAVHDGSEWFLFDTCSWWDSTLIEDPKVYNPNGDGFWSMKEQYTSDSLEYNELFYVTREGYERFNFFNTGPANDTTYAMASTNNYTYFATKFGLSYRSRLDSSWECWRPIHFVDSTNFLIDSISALTSVNNKLWVATNSSYSEYPLACYANGKWEFYSKEEIGSSDITSVTAKKDNTIYIGTGSGIITYQNGTFSFLDNTLSVRELTIRNGVLWAAAETGLFRFIGAARDSISSDKFTSLSCDTTGTLWAGTQTNSIALFDGFSRTDITLPDDISGAVSAVKCDSFGNIWVGTDKGVGKWNGSVWSHYNSSNSVLQSDNIGLITVMPDGSKWFATKYNGVVHLVDEEQIPMSNSTLATMPKSAGMTAIGENIQLTLTTSSNVKLDIFDLRGRLLVHRNLGELDAGIHNIPTGRDLARGCHIARVSAGDLVLAVRVVQ